MDQDGELPNPEDFNPEPGPSQESVTTRRRRVDYKKHKKFSEKEIQALVKEIMARFHNLFVSKTPQNVRNALWDEVLIIVNSVGVEQRSVTQIRKKWNDLRSLVKRKMGQLYQQARQPGVPTTPITFTPTEELDRTTYSREKIEGVADMDVMSLAHRSHEPTLPVADSETLAHETTTGVVQDSLRQSEVEEQQNHEEDLGFTPAQVRFLNRYTEDNQEHLKEISCGIKTMNKTLSTMCDLYAHKLKTEGVIMGQEGNNNNNIALPNFVRASPPSPSEFSVSNLPPSVRASPPSPSQFSVSNLSQSVLNVRESDVTSTSSAISLYSITGLSGLFPLSQTLAATPTTSSQIFHQSPALSFHDLGTPNFSCPPLTVSTLENTNHPSSNTLPQNINDATSARSISASCVPLKKRHHFF